MIGKIIKNKYEVIKELGKGGMATVYLVKDWKLDKCWAMKVLASSQVNNQEFHILKKLDHIGIPRVVDWFEWGNRYIYIMDFVDGKTLDKVILQHGVLNSDKVKNIAIQLCDILHYLHKQKPPIIYRDMKPSNIIINTANQVKLIDFGIARLYKKHQLVDTQILGTRGYCPLEQYGVMQTDKRSDIYALGMTLHYLLTAKDPRQSNYVYQSAYRLNKHVSKRLSRIIDKCTQTHSKKRYSDCLSIKNDLKAYIYLPYRRIMLSVVVISIVLSSMYIYQQYKNDEKYTRYNTLLHQPYSEQNFNHYIEAVHLLPNRIEAYEQLIDLLDSTLVIDDEFTYKRNQLLALQREYSDVLNVTEQKVQQFYYNLARQLLIGTAIYEKDFYYQIKQAYLLFGVLSSNSLYLNNNKIIKTYYNFCHIYITYAATQLNVKEMSATHWTSLIEQMENVLNSNTMETFDCLILSQLFLNVLFKQKNSMIAHHFVERVDSILRYMITIIQQFNVSKPILIQLKNTVLETLDSVIFVIQQGGEAN